MYWFSGVCLLRVAVLTAVMIWRVMQQLREVAEARLAIGAVVANRLVEADEALLDQIVAVAAGEEVRRRLETHEAVVTADETVVRVRVSLLCKGDEESVIDLKLRLRVLGDSSHEHVLSRDRVTAIRCSVALHLPWRAPIFSFGWVDQGSSSSPPLLTGRSLPSYAPAVKG